MRVGLVMQFLVSQGEVGFALIRTSGCRGVKRYCVERMYK